MKDGDFIRIDYIGKISESGEVFDLTKENIAKEKGIYNPALTYKPIPIIVGANFVVKGLEKGLKEMKVGEKKKIKVKPEEAFGERSPKLIKLIPLSEFKRQKKDPFPGMIVTINNLHGRILSVTGGRVKIDFNHPLSGKTLEYDVEIKEKITKRMEKIKAILEFFLKIKEVFNVSVKNEIVEIEIKKMDLPKELKKNIVDIILKWIKSIKKIRFIQEFEQ
jgi:FKBP-type peptidyl-prolyl cis-trans isomerase 2